MLGRVRRRQTEDNPSIEQSRPAVTSRSTDFYKAVMVQSQRLRLEYAHLCPSHVCTADSCCSRDEDYDVTENTILTSQLFPAHFTEIKRAIFMETKQRELARPLPASRH
jgi:hypothetical protein